MSDDERNDPIDEKDLPEEGNSNARLYPPVEDAENPEDDPQQPQQGDAAAVRDGEPAPHDGM